MISCKWHPRLNVARTWCIKENFLFFSFHFILLVRAAVGSYKQYLENSLNKPKPYTEVTAKPCNYILTLPFRAFIKALFHLVGYLQVQLFFCIFFPSPLLLLPSACCSNQVSHKATVEMIGSNCNECLCLLTAVLIWEPCTKQSVIYSVCVSRSRTRTGIVKQHKTE